MNTCCDVLKVCESTCQAGMPLADLLVAALAVGCIVAGLAPVVRGMLRWSRWTAGRCGLRPVEA